MIDGGYLMRAAKRDRRLTRRESHGVATVAYGHMRTAQTQLYAHLRGLIEHDARHLCDVGGGATPLLSPSEVREFGLDYVVLDASQDELAKAPRGYQMTRANILDPVAIDTLVRERGAFDVVVSRWTAEHVPDGRRFHEQVFRMLRPGGTALHLFPTLYSLPFVLNRALPPRVSAFLVTHVDGSRWTPGPDAKFRAYYSWCRGPSRRQARRFESVGFSVEHYVGFFGHTYYRPITALDLAHRFVTDKILAHPRPSLTSFALVVLTRQGPRDASVAGKGARRSSWS